MKKIKLPTLIIALLFFSSALFAQQEISYSRMDGLLGNNIHVTGNFRRVGPKLEGSYSHQLFANDSVVHLSHIVILFGHIDKHNEVVFKQYQNEDTTIDGLFYAHHFAGSWDLTWKKRNRLR